MSLAFRPATVAAPVVLLLSTLISAGPLPQPGGEAGEGGGVGVAADYIPGRAFYFTRAIYSDWRGDYGYRRRGGGAWATDYPKADAQFMIGVRRLTNIDGYEYENAVRLDDPDLRRFPFIYAVEVGYMQLSEGEVQGLRSFLLAGGLLVVDDFWGTEEWYSFEQQIKRVLPEHPIVEVPRDHPLLQTFYAIDEIVQVPNIGNGRRGGPTWERDGYDPHLRGIFDEQGRLMVAISWNSDLGDAWEWAEDPYYPIRFSNYAYQIGVNLIIYGMSR